MYHYIPYTATGGGLLWRDPADVREELSAIRTLLGESERRLSEAESLKEELIETLAHSTVTPENLISLDAVVNDCEERKAMLEELWERTDALREELSDALFLLRGIRT